MSATSKGADFTVGDGVNHRDFDGIQTLVSNAWCMTNCLAPMAMALDEVFGFEGGLMITVHAYTPDQYLQDVCTATIAARAAAVNVVPTSGGLVKIVGWYDNEWGYSHRLADLTGLVASSL